ncbi:MULTISPECIES: DUF2637 domain-containing protein [Mycolicibacterium]|uniref:DUF2637 domain-containing protein n=1 Tax=Mycolicibacterium TaxID=1866885 RepID=UPI0007EA396B|nr:DUF2637 domain-containing protein [Mycolicibacterium fortuitum]OBG24068.1 hypothetical protein A5768_22095 [Mycolicibacterium fortuitum]
MTPTAAALKHRAATRRLALFLLFAFTTASVAGNVVVVLRRTTAAPEDVVVAAIMPLVLAGMAHTLAKLIQSGLPASDIGRWVYGISIGAVAVIALGAFVLSFENLAALAQRQHNEIVAAVFPATLDLAIVVCTGILVVTAKANENDQAAGVEPYRGWLAQRVTRWSTSPVQAVQSPSGEALPHPHPVAQPVQSAPVLQPIAPAVTVPTPEQVEAVPQSQPVQSAQVAPVDWPTPGLSQPMQWAGQSGAEPVVSSENVVPHLVTAPVAVEPEQVEAPVLAVEQEPITEPMQSVPAADAVPHPVEVEQPAEAPEQSTPVVEELPRPEQGPSRPQLVAIRTEAEVVHRVVEHKGGAAPVTESHVVEAEQLRDRGVTGKPTPTVADTLALADEKVSRNEIARVTGWSTHTVSKVLNGRETETEAVNA